MTASSLSIPALLDSVSGGTQQVITFPVGGSPSIEIYLLPDLPHLPRPVISPPQFQGNPDL